MILNLLRRHAGLMLYTALNYLDKAFAVAVPLLVLWATKDQGLYNQVEYIYALGALAVVALELGVRNYLLFGYREAADREQFMVLIGFCNASALVRAVGIPFSLFSRLRAPKYSPFPMTYRGDVVLRRNSISRVPIEWRAIVDRPLACLSAVN